MSSSGELGQGFQLNFCSAPLERQEGNWGEDYMPDGNYLLIMGALGTGFGLVNLYICVKEMYQPASLPLFHCGPGTDNSWCCPLLMGT